MAILYRKVKRADPRTGLDGKFYVKQVSSGLVDTHEIALEMARLAVQSCGTIEGLLHDINSCVVDLLLQGYKVRLADVGIVGLRLHGGGVDAEDAYGPEQVRHVQLQFEPSAKLKRAVNDGMNGVEFKEVE